MAAAWFNALSDSARGTRAFRRHRTQVHASTPDVPAAMREVGIELASASSQKLTDELAATASTLVTTGCGEACPVVPGLRGMDWPPEDPMGKSIERCGKSATRSAIASPICWPQSNGQSSERPSEEQHHGRHKTRAVLVHRQLGNSARSQIAEALTNHLCAGRFDAVSA
jgi:arsenate reductase (thioredoxin)